MAFWKLAFNMGWIDANKLRLVVKTISNPGGEITEVEYMLITGEEF